MRFRALGRSDGRRHLHSSKEYQEKLAARLADRRVPKKLLIDIIKAFDPEQKLSGADKTELSERAVEQLTHVRTRPTTCGRSERA